MNTLSQKVKINSNRTGLQDIWNAQMLIGAQYSSHDFPLCPTTATEVPKALISYSEAKTLHNKEMKLGHTTYHHDAFIHFYIDDQKFDGKRSSIWLYPDKALEIIKHFSGIVAPDFSTNSDFPDPIKRINFYKMNSFGYWIGSLGIPVISNVRWGTEETWDYCFDSNPHNSMIAIGTVASRIHQLKNRPLFENGLFYMVELLQPHTIITYGSSNYGCFDLLRQAGIRIVSFPSQTSQAFAKRKRS